jgi:3-hydroxyisobutyrate dehydrogenase-like beta-hydroxyacid dehydrogenase
MGQAIASTLLQRGNRVTVWNRTASRADELVAAGATRAETLAAAVSAGGPVLLSLRDHDVARELLAPIADRLRDRLIVNLSSGTPAEARELAAWVKWHGARYVAGGLRVPPSGIGDPSGRAYYSGAREDVETALPLLEPLTTVEHRGEDPGAALLWYQLEESLLWTAMSGWLQTIALARANGVTAAELLPSAIGTFASMGELAGFYTPRIDAGDHGGEADTLASATGSVAHVAETARDSGVDPALPEAIHALFQRAVAAGHGADSTTSVVELIAAAPTA